MKKDIKNKVKFGFVIVLALGMAFYSVSFSQDTEVKPVTVGQTMPDFTLPVYQGGDLTISSFRGKNVLLVFPRGFAREDYWCTICNYKYAELVDLEQKEQIRKKYNVEILYVLPYSKEVVKQWLESHSGQLEKIKKWKNPSEPDKLDERGKSRMERSRKGFPKELSMKAGDVPTPFPILIDEERKLTKGLGIFATEWGGGKVDQLIPSFYIIDKQGILQFKYIGQNTWDRPSYDYLMKVLEMINNSK